MIDDLEVMRLQKLLAAAHSPTTLYEDYYWFATLATDSNDWQALAMDLILSPRKPVDACGPNEAGENWMIPGIQKVRHAVFFGYAADRR